MIILVHPPKTKGIVDPTRSANNRFGIHVIDENDLESAARLINTNGGAWGYVTLVIRDNDRDTVKWQRTFDKMRRLKLIPLVRLATSLEGDAWRKPVPTDAQAWADFLNSLNWVVKNRYVILFNEPNHAKEWGNDLKPDEYSQVVNAFYQTLKTASPDFFLLPAGFDLAAPTSQETMDALQYWQFMHGGDKEIFTRFDGWTSHSYPNPNFSGKVTDSGRTSIKGYRWELGVLQGLGLDPNLPIFITETGWQHTDGQSSQYGVYTPEKLVSLYVSAFTDIWQDPNLVAVTPFLLNYQNPPFDHFSFTKVGGSEVYPHYTAISLLPKTAGKPVQNRSAQIEQPFMPPSLISGSSYRLPLTLTNTGQSIWDEGYQLTLTSLFVDTGILTIPLPPLEPSQTQTLFFQAHTPLETTYKITSDLNITDAGQPIILPIKNVTTVIPPPSILAKVKLWYRSISSGDDFALLLYDQGGLVKKIEPFTVIDGLGVVQEVRDVIPDRSYRFVLTKPYYLPRQTTAILAQDRTLIQFDRLVPIDFYPDGAFTIKDLWYAIIHPRLTINLLLTR